MSDTNTVASSPLPTMQVLLYTLLRAILVILGALGIGIGANLNDGTLMVIAGALATILGVAWSIYQKVSAARTQHAVAVASAQAGAPVKPSAA